MSTPPSAAPPTRAERLAVVGATGRTGRRTVAAAVAARVPVVALCRRPEAADGFPPQVEVRPFSGRDGPALRAALDDVSAVVCAFGPRPPYTDVFCAAATSTLVDAMTAAGVRRLVCLTGAMVGQFPDHWSVGVRLMVCLFARQQPALAADRAAQERVVAGSGLAWTLVKPPRLTDGPARGRVVAGPDVSVSLFSRLSRADLAAFLLDLARSDRFVHDRVFVRN